jgi:hypothetical protein
LDLPLQGKAANGSDGAARIGHRMIIDGVLGAFLSCQSISQNECRNALVSEPLSQRISFVTQAQHPMATTRRDDDGCRIARLGLWQIHTQGRGMDVGDIACPIGSVDSLDLIFPVLGTWCSRWPQHDAIGLRSESLQANRAYKKDP